MEIETPHCEGDKTIEITYSHMPAYFHFRLPKKCNIVTEFLRNKIIERKHQDPLFQGVTVKTNERDKPLVHTIRIGVSSQVDEENLNQILITFQMWIDEKRENNIKQDCCYLSATLNGQKVSSSIY